MSTVEHSKRLGESKSLNYIVRIHVNGVKSDLFGFAKICQMVSDNFSELEKYRDILFISLSNIDPEIQNNIISVGVSLESQLISIKKFLKKENKKQHTAIIEG